jgi:hypothetical protein
VVGGEFPMVSGRFGSGGYIAIGDRLRTERVVERGFWRLAKRTRENHEKLEIQVGKRF